MKRLIILLWSISGINVVVAQQNMTQQRKNTIKLELAASLWYNNALGVSYERITKPNQSFAVSAGYQELRRSPRLGENIATKEDRSKHGYKFGAEYRFYLTKENKYPAPRGLYMGPYFTQHRFNNERILEVSHDGTTEQTILNTKFTVVNFGVQLGYQFLINSRWTIDLVFIGPSVSRYRYSIDLSGNYTFDPADIKSEIIRDFIERFPLLEEVLSEKRATRSGELDTWSYGYRYQFHIGYHFGRKK
jgi:hypothetical protein